MFNFIVGVLVGIGGSYCLSGVLRDRWARAAANYEWLTESEKRFYIYLSQRIYQMYLSGELKAMLEEATKADNIMDPPNDFVRMKEEEYYMKWASAQSHNYPAGMKNVTPTGSLA